MACLPNRLIPRGTRPTASKAIQAVRYHPKNSKIFVDFA